MKVIWKFELMAINEQLIEMPVGAEILCLQTQFGKPCIWALISQTERKEYRRFEVYGTGHQMSEDKRKYIGTFQIDEGALVFHCFEVL